MSATAEIITLKCHHCAADVYFSPTDAALKCVSCGSIIHRDEAERQPVHEHNFNEYLDLLIGENEVVDTVVAECSSCGAKITFQGNDLIEDCPYCNTSIVNCAHREMLLQPQYMLPFKVDRETARKEFKKWKKSLWFAPNKFIQESKANRLNGVYMPFWTYDFFAKTNYSGERGDNYTVTRTNSKGVSSTEIKTRWSYAAGIVRNSFDDILIYASNTFDNKLINELEPWDLQKLEKFDHDKLRGFDGETYSINLECGFNEATEMAENKIRETVRKDIGGNKQRIHSLNSSYDDITFKYIMLPIWFSGFNFNNKEYRFYINARTGEVQGERPWSIIKIISFILTMITLGTLTAYLIFNHL